jgi:hypothetical protein
MLVSLFCPRPHLREGNSAVPFAGQRDLRSFSLESVSCSCCAAKVWAAQYARNGSVLLRSHTLRFSQKPLTLGLKVVGYSLSASPKPNGRDLIRKQAREPPQFGGRPLQRAWPPYCSATSTRRFRTEWRWLEHDEERNPYPAELSGPRRTSS